MKNDKKLDNLKPFKKGESGNLNGRPKGSRNWSTVIDEMLNEERDVTVNNVRTKETTQKLMVRAMIKKAMAGSEKAFTAITNRHEGLPKQKIETKDITPSSKNTKLLQEMTKELRTDINEDDKNKS